MGVALIAAAAYKRMMWLLMPASRMLNAVESTVLGQVFLANGDELERVSQRAADLIEESDPRTALELLPEYEAMLELSSSGTNDERRARIEALLVKRQGTRPIDYQQALAPVLNLKIVDVVVIEHDRAFAILTANDESIFEFFIYRNPAAPGTYQLDVAQDIVNNMKQTHTIGYVIESVSFLCDDPYSLCDRDLLGV